MSPSRKLHALLLGPDRDMRHAAYLCLSSLIGYLLYGLLCAVQVHYGTMSAAAAAWTTAASLVCCCVFYALIRSGRARRLRWDPTLGRTQLATGIGFFWVTYALSGPAALATPIIVASHIVYAMFGMAPRQVYRLAALSLVALAALMAVCNQLQPVRYPAALQVLAWLYTALVVGLVARLAQQVATMQASLREQRTQLLGALEQVRVLAEHDELTGLVNRRSMVQLLSRVQAEAASMDGLGCVALLDVDHFKRINDVHGHAVGDEVLRGFANVARAALRSSDTVARWGGEEFLVYLPGTPPAGAQAMLQRLQSAMAAALLVPHKPGLAVTFSAGLAELQAGQPVDATIGLADVALYSAKHAGRNRVELAAA